MTKTGMTQKQRSAATRRKLLDAATDVLIQDGYANLTTTRVCKAAGVSQGALFKHYASKMDLMAALAEDLYAGLAREFKASFETANRPDGEPAREGDLIRQAIRTLWEVFSSPRQLASYDLTLAARTDTTLADILAPIVLAHRQRIRDIAQTISMQLPGMAEADFFNLSDVILMAIQGAVINSLACPEPDILENRLTYIESLARNLAGPKEAS